MDLYNNELYLEDILYVSKTSIPWDKLKDKSILISGATGMVGSFFVDVIMYNNTKGLNCTIYALGRDKEKAMKRFPKYFGDLHFVFIRNNVREKLVCDSIGKIDYVIHLASNTHPMQYATDPIGTITTNIIGLQNLLDFAVSHQASRFMFASSNEIYGENRGDVELFDESYCGYIDSNTLRAGYPESKRCGEALCQAYRSQKNIEIVIPRITRTYGPTMLMSDTKAISQFIKKGIAGENVILKSEGTQYYSYQYVADTVSGLLFVMLLGENGEAYNIADESSDITLKDIASIIAEHSGNKVIFEIPDVVESTGYSKATKARLSGEKIKELGWLPKYDIRSGTKRTMLILSEN